MTETNKALAQRADDALDPAMKDDALAVIQRRELYLERWVPAAIAATDPSQWQMLGDAPWCSGPAAEAIARKCGVSFDEPEALRTAYDDDGGAPGYRWTYRARFYLPGNIDSTWAEGHAGSRDQFLGTGVDGKTRALYEVNEGHIMQKALTNMKVNGVLALLGIRRMSRERLDAIFAGKGGTGAMARVEYRAGAQGGGRGQTAQDVEIKFGKGKGKMLSELPDDDVRYYLGAWQRDLADPGKEKFHRTCKANAAIAEAMLAARAAAKKPPAGDTQQQGTPPQGQQHQASAYDQLFKEAEAAGINQTLLLEELKARGVTKKPQVTAAIAAEILTKLRPARNPEQGREPGSDDGEEDIPGWGSGGGK